MNSTRTMLTVLATALAVTACHHSSDSAPPATNPNVTALDSNPRVLQNGRCHFLVDSHMYMAQLDRKNYEGPLDKAISELDAARAARANRRTIIKKAHVVRKLYYKMMIKWRKPLLDEWGGPFRCVVKSRNYEEISTDDLFSNTPRYTAYVESLRDIPGKYDKEPMIEEAIAYPGGP